MKGYQHSELRDFLRRLAEWDVLNLAPGSGDDGPYWQGEIVKATAALARLEEQLESLREEINSWLEDYATGGVDAGGALDGIAEALDASIPASELPYDGLDKSGIESREPHGNFTGADWQGEGPPPPDPATERDYVDKSLSGTVRGEPLPVRVSDPARVHDVSIDDSQNEPPDIRTDDDFGI